MATEAVIWRWLSAAGDAPRPGLHMHRVENMVASAGPDVEGQYRAAHFHIELKVLRDQGFAGTPEETGRLKFRTGQREWARMRWEVGGIAYILIEGFKGELYLIPGAFAMALDQIGTAKTAYLKSLSLWTRKKDAEARDHLFDRVILRPDQARDAVALRLQRDPQLHAASQRIGGLAQALGSLPAS